MESKGNIITPLIVRYFALIPLVCGLFSAPAEPFSPTANSTNVLSIYMLAGTWRTNLRVDAVRLSDVELERQPALADHDFVAFNTNSHSFAVTAAAARRLAREFKGGTGKVRGDGKPEYSFDAPDAPFLLMAMGERIYLGVLKSVYSSMGYSVPVLMPEAISVGADETNDVWFLVLEGGPHAPPPLPAGSEVIRGPGRRALLVMPDGTTNSLKSLPLTNSMDIRNDNRIIGAVRKLFGDQKR